MYYVMYVTWNVRKGGNTCKDGWIDRSNFGSFLIINSMTKNNTG